MFWSKSLQYCLSIKSVWQRCQALGEMIGFTTRFFLVLDFFRQQWRQAWRKALMITIVTFAYFLLILSCIISLPPCSVSPCSKIGTSNSSSTGTYLRVEPRLINFRTICPFDSMFKTVRGLVRFISSRVDFSPTLFSASSLATFLSWSALVPTLKVCFY